MQEYVTELSEGSLNVAQHTAKSLKLFIKRVLKDPILYQAFKTLRIDYGLVAEPLTLEVVKSVSEDRNLE